MNERWQKVERVSKLDRQFVMASMLGQRKGYSESSKGEEGNKKEERGLAIGE